MLYPLKEVIDFSSLIRESGKGYKITHDEVFVLPNKTGKSLPPVRGKRKWIKVTSGCIIIGVEKNYWYDGSTLSIDTDDRMIFALLHDIACEVSQDTFNPIYEDLLDDLAYEIIRKQGPWYNWFRAWRTEVAVKKWRSTPIA